MKNKNGRFALKTIGGVWTDSVIAITTAVAAAASAPGFSRTTTASLIHNRKFYETIQNRV
jgi:hypothetical protein